MVEKALVVDGQVIKTGLPRSLKSSEGEWISNVDTLSDAMLESYGWLPIIEESIDFDTELYTVHSQGYEVREGKVYRSYTQIPLPARLIVDKKTLLADEQDKVVVTFFDANAPSMKTFIVNGINQEIAVEDGRASLEVFASTPGEIIVQCDDKSVTIIAVEES